MQFAETEVEHSTALETVCTCVFVKHFNDSLQLRYYNLGLLDISFHVFNLCFIVINAIKAQNTLQIAAYKIIILIALTYKLINNNDNRKMTPQSAHWLYDLSLLSV